MAEILLINENVMKSVGLINDNVDSCYLQPAMVLAQEVSLQQLIGTKLLKKIKSLISDGTIDEPDNNKYKVLLVDYIKNYLIWQTTSEIQIPVNYKITNSGVIQNEDERKAGVDMKNVQYLKEYYASKALFFGKLLTDYLCKNSGLYPEYRGSSVDGIVADDDDYAHIYFPGITNKRHNYGY